MTVYFDTNIYIYLANKKSPFYEQCINLYRYLLVKRYAIYTSTETIQEIIHVSKNAKQIKNGILNAELSLHLTTEVVPIDLRTVRIFLEKNKKYMLNSSRDLLHLSVCLQNNIKQIISLDGGFKNFSEIELYSPDEYLKKYV